MNFIQSGSILAIGILYLVAIYLFCKSFTKNKSIAILLVVPVFLFISGYFLRINGNKWEVDLGYFMTDSSSIFLYAIFTGSLILGQIKFWKK